MHELGIMIEIIKIVEHFVRQNDITQVDTLVLQIGELAPVVPEYIRQCYPAAVDGSLLQNTKLKIETLPANGICKQCSKVFDIPENGKKCPYCGNSSCELLGGKEFMIKEIIAY